MSVKSIREALSWAAAQIGRSESDSPRLDAELLLANTLERPRSFLFSHAETLLSLPQLSHYRQQVEQRCRGKPIAYLTGHREFWSMVFSVTPDVLIPRPDTECLVEAILKLPIASTSTVIDLGTGSGAIVAALAIERPDWFCIATDFYFASLRIAQQNFASNQLSVATVQASWMTGFAANSFDLVVSNPPYVASDDPHLQQGDLRFEPPFALVSEKQGLADIADILQQADVALKPGGYIVMEHGWQQQADVISLASDAAYVNLTGFNDYTNTPRYIIGQKAL